MAKEIFYSDDEMRDLQAFYADHPKIDPGEYGVEQQPYTLPGVSESRAKAIVTYTKDSSSKD